MATSTWNDLCTTVNGWGKTINRKAEQLSEATALHLKLSAKRADLEDAYLKLGRLTYENLQSDSTVEDGAIADALLTVATLREEIANLEAILQSNKKA